MKFTGTQNGKGLKLILETILQEFKSGTATLKPGELNFVLGFSISSVSDADSPGSVEAKLNALAGAARALSNNDHFAFEVQIEPAMPMMDKIRTDTERKVNDQLSILAEPEKKLVLPNGAIPKRNRA